MRMVLILSIFILAIFLISKKIIYLAKINLFKDQAAWSNKNIKIKYSNAEETPKTIEIDNYLKIISDESKLYLEDQSNEEEE